MAKLLYLGEIPAVHIPNQHARTWRELIIHRSKLVQKRTRAKKSLRVLLRSVGITASRRLGLWTKKGLACLRELGLPSSTHALRRDLFLEELTSITGQIERVEKELKRFSEPSGDLFQLMSHPGVGIRTAEAVVAFLDDPAGSRTPSRRDATSDWFRRKINRANATISAI